MAIQPFRLGIIGHAAEKFDKRTEALAKDEIIRAIVQYAPTSIVSGHSPMGGVDIWAEEKAAIYGIPTTIYAPDEHTWAGINGFKDRNLRIAGGSDLVLVIVVEKLPKGFRGMKFDGCYHCKGKNPDHVKSGACWTAWKSGVGQWRIIK
jgi:hypothetical protein